MRPVALMTSRSVLASCCREGGVRTIEEEELWIPPGNDGREDHILDTNTRNFDWSLVCWVMRHFSSSQTRDAEHGQSVQVPTGTILGTSPRPRIRVCRHIRVNCTSRSPLSIAFGLNDFLSLPSRRCMPHRNVGTGREVGNAHQGDRY